MDEPFPVSGAICHPRGTKPGKDSLPAVLTAVGVDGNQPGQYADGRVRLYVIGQGAMGAAASEATKHDVGRAEEWNMPIVLMNSQNAIR